MFGALTFQKQRHEFAVGVTTTKPDSNSALSLLLSVPDPVQSTDSVRCTFDVHFTDVVGHNGHAHECYDEWFDLFDDALVDPASGVFRPVGSGLKQNLYLNPDSLHDIGDHHLLYYFATGRFIGRVMLAGYTLSFHLALPLLRMMLDLLLSLSDVEYVDCEGYKRIVDALSVSEDRDDDGNALEKLELHFSVMKQLADGGGYEVVDLISDGRHVAVAHDNKLEYMEHVFRYTLFENVSSQLHVFLSGFYEVIPRELLLLFDPEELDYVLCESHEINIVESKKTRRSKKTTKKTSKRRERKSLSLSDGITEMLVEDGAISLEIALEIDQVRAEVLADVCFRAWMWKLCAV